MSHDSLKIMIAHHFCPPPSSPLLPAYFASSQITTQAIPIPSKVYKLPLPAPFPWVSRWCNGNIPGVENFRVCMRAAGRQRFESVTGSPTPFFSFSFFFLNLFGFFLFFSFFFFFTGFKKVYYSALRIDPPHHASREKQINIHESRSVNRQLSYLPTYLPV